MKERYRRVARLHMEAINQGFLSSLGENFLSLLYEAIGTAENSILIVEEKDGKLLGFVSGGTGMGAIYRRMVRRMPKLIVALLPVLCSPKKIARIVEILKYKKPDGADTAFFKAELYSIAVSPDAYGQGVAQRLYERLVTYFHDRGEPGFSIVVGASLVSAHRFYQKMGAVPVSRITVHSGEESLLYEHKLNKQGN